LREAAALRLREAATLRLREAAPCYHTERARPLPVAFGRGDTR